jgi:hypothetical protein
MERTRIKIIIVLLAVSVVFGSPVMTRPGFYAIEIGTPVDAVIRAHGEPYSIKTNQNGSKDYLYIERIPAGEETVEENRYILVIKNGQVISKRYNQELPPAYDEIYDDDPNDVPN